VNGYGEQRLQRIGKLRAEMTEWVEGRRSWTNTIRSTTGDPAWETALIAQADAAEVVKLSAAIQAEAALGASLGWNS